MLPPLHPRPTHTHLSCRHSTRTAPLGLFFVPFIVAVPHSETERLALGAQLHLDRLDDAILALWLNGRGGGGRKRDTSVDMTDATPSMPLLTTRYFCLQPVFPCLENALPTHPVQLFPPIPPYTLTLPSPSPGLKPIFMSSFIPIPLLCFSKFAN